MAAKEKEYQRLPGSGMRRQGFVTVVSVRCRLWLGKDHILSIDSQRFAEDYKRFYFRDIQAFIISKSNFFMIVNAICCTLLVFTLAPFLVYKGGAAVFWGIMVGISLALLAINLAYGPSCRVHLRTAVQTEELPSLRRVRRARKVLARLQPLITEAQVELVPVETAPAVEPPPAVADIPEAPPSTTV